MQSKIAFITGITGQDGAYLSELLLLNGYKVIGLTRSYTRSNKSRLDYLGIKDRVILEECDLQDLSRVIQLINQFQPNEIYNLAAQSSVSFSFLQPTGTIKFNIVSVLNLLEAIRITNPKIKFYQASSSEMFGKAESLPICETTVFRPLSPYAISKASAHWIAVNYREAFGLFTSCGILFNHESHLRSNNFFIKKIILQSIQIKYFGQEKLEVGNIDIKRDFGFAKKYVEAMYLMLQQEKPDDYVICSGVSISLREIIWHVFNRLGISKDKISVNEKFFRPTEINDIFGDSTKAKQKLGWIYDLSFFDVLDILLEEELTNMKMNNKLFTF